MRTRSHHNNTGLRGIKNGQTRKFAKKLKSEYVKQEQKELGTSAFDRWCEGLEDE